MSIAPIGGLIQSHSVAIPVPTLRVNSSPFMINQRNLREKTITTKDPTETSSSPSYSSSFPLYLLGGIAVVGVLIFTAPTKTKPPVGSAYITPTT